MKINPMKTIYSSGFLCFLLAGFSSQAQVNRTTSASAASSPAIALSAAETAVLQAASNAVQAATRVWLTNQVLRAAPAAPASTLSTATAGASVAGVGVAMTDASTNGTQAVTRLRLQNQPVAPATMTSAARRTNNQLVPMDSGSACVRPGSGLVSWWRAEGGASDAMGANPGTLVNGASFSDGKVGQAFLLDGSSQYVEIPYSANRVVSRERNPRRNPSLKRCLGHARKGGR